MVDKMELANEIFYLMRHNEYGDSVAAVILKCRWRAGSTGFGEWI